MDKKKLHSAIGFAMRAGKVAAGDFIVEKTLKCKKAYVLLIDESASDNTREKYVTICEKTEIPLLTIDELGHRIGKSGIKIACVTDRHFAKMIKDAYASQDCTENNTGVSH